jgi:hypothetical protein
VCQVKHDLMMFWVPSVRRRWKARKVKRRGISNVARGLFPEKGDRMMYKKTRPGNETPGLVLGYRLLVMGNVRF